MKDDLLTSLEQVRWQTAFRTYGNDHATLIGLLVDWWITAAPDTRWALEGGPSFGHRPKGLGGGLCDAILGEGDCSKGVIEVEGTRCDDTIRKIGEFFSPEAAADLQSLEFGIFLAYAYSPQGKGRERHIPDLPLKDFVDLGRKVTKDNPGRCLAILTLDKTWERIQTGPRAKNEWYMGSPAKIHGVLLLNGEEIASKDLFPSLPEAGHS
ncbi:MAG: hypothetical protein M1358_21605 [Chloroflexi bacterium]|nr:hypothetical protein [Chloroflexota bacterium]